MPVTDYNMEIGQIWKFLKGREKNKPFLPPDSSGSCDKPGEDGMSLVPSPGPGSANISLLKHGNNWSRKTECDKVFDPWITATICCPFLKVQTPLLTVDNMKAL
jgi:hypothetical protein